MKRLKGEILTVLTIILFAALAAGAATPELWDLFTDAARRVLLQFGE